MLSPLQTAMGNLLRQRQYSNFASSAYEIGPNIAASGGAGGGSAMPESERQKQDIASIGEALFEEGLEHRLDCYRKGSNAW